MNTWRSEHVHPSPSCLAHVRIHIYFLNEEGSSFQCWICCLFALGHFLLENRSWNWLIQKEEHLDLEICHTFFSESFIFAAEIEKGEGHFGGWDLNTYEMCVCVCVCVCVAFLALNFPAQLWEVFYQMIIVMKMLGKWNSVILQWFNIFQMPNVRGVWHCT